MLTKFFVIDLPTGYFTGLDTPTASYALDLRVIRYISAEVAALAIKHLNIVDGIVNECTFLQYGVYLKPCAMPEPPQKCDYPGCNGVKNHVECPICGLDHCVDDSCMLELNG